MSNRRPIDEGKRRKTGTERDRSRSPRRGDLHRDKQPPSAERKLDNIALDAKNRLKNVGIQMKLNKQRAGGGDNSGSAPTSRKISVATAFNQDSDDEPEQMPPEAKMRMRNIGRDTPTSSGPNSFGKTKHGFSDSKKMFERKMRVVMEGTPQEQSDTQGQLLRELIENKEH